MIQGHALNVLLEPGFEEHPVFAAWLFLRGLTSCLFLFLSGFAFSVASDRHWDDYLRPSTRVFRRLGRFVFFLALGYLIRFPMGRFEHLKFADEERWRSFLSVDILQVVAVSLLVLQALVALTRQRGRFGVTCLGLASFVVLVTPITWSQTWASLPLWLASFLTAETGSLFPFFPWAAFIFLGAAFGTGYALYGRQLPLIGTVQRLTLIGSAALILGLMFHLVPLRPYGNLDFWRTSPNLFLIRFGSLLLVLAGMAYISRFVARLPAMLRALAEESLTIYVVHVALLYGSLWNVGLGTRVGPQSLPRTIGWILILWAAMTLLAWTWNRIKRIHPALTFAIRLVIAFLLIRPLV